MTGTGVRDALREALGSRVVTDPDAMTAFTRDHCVATPAGRPAAVVRAGSADDVVTTLRLATEHRTPVVTWGTGTGLAGGANALDGAVTLVLAGMDRILDVDPDTRLAVVEPGVINADLDAAARRLGLFYAPDPGSRDISSIGGNIATNAGGMCCTKYGVTADHVAALTAVLADGSVVRTGSATRKDVTGLDLTRLLVGSEGTLAVVVEATVRLRPVPQGIATVVAAFPTTTQAVRAVVALTSAVQPSAVELLDRTTVGAVESMARMGLDTTAGALLLVQCDGPSALAEATQCVAVCEQHGGRDVLVTDDAEESEAFMAARRLALPALERLGTILLDDVAVPVPALPALVSAVEDVAARHDLVIGTFGHAADGNLHPTIVHDPADTATAVAAFDEIIEAALALGGTTSGEHGIGALKVRHAATQLGTAERDLMHRVKRAFDPLGILNPGRAY